MGYPVEQQKYQVWSAIMPYSFRINESRGWR